MDSLSRLLEVAHLRATLDKHCMLSASTVMDVAPQRSRSAAFHVLLEGTARFHVEGVELNLQAGDVVVIPSGAGHRVTTRGPEPVRATHETFGSAFTTTRTRGEGDPVIDLYCGHFDYGPGAGDVLFRTLPTPLRVSLATTAEEASMLRALSDLLRGETSNEGRGTAAVMSALCTVLLALVLRTAGSETGTAPVWTSMTDAGVGRVIDSVLRAPGDGWTIATLSETARMSRATFLRRFAASTGMTPGQFLTKVRIMAGADLLTGDDLTVAAVAAAVGYQSESSFSRAFRVEIGRSPGSFRRESRKPLPTRVVNPDHEPRS
ncbi:cupin domain-containing protein [Rathayibacter sp. KR2-224]|uniref:AraC family transcriptional regulator n=1 Tax=Rathayibacter sp. KR2-224 TaxID=3400913 RepID=UPI003C036E73